MNKVPPSCIIIRYSGPLPARRTHCQPLKGTPMSCCDLAAILAPRGYWILKLAPGAGLCCISLPNDQTDKIAPGWVGSWNPGGGFERREIRAVAVDRGGWAL